MVCIVSDAASVSNSFDMQLRCIYGRGGAGLAVRAGGRRAGTRCPLAQYRGLSELEIPFANGPISAGYVPDVWLKTAGSAPRRFGMDTGSTGIVVAAEHYTPGPDDVPTGPGRLVYNSSGRILTGKQYVTDVVIQRDGSTPRGHGPRAGAARHGHHLPGARARLPARAQSARRGPLGVGFDRTGAQGTARRCAREIPSPAWSRWLRARRSPRFGPATS